MNPTVKKTAEQIKKLKIQGASQIRRYAVLAIKKSVFESKAKTIASFRKELRRHMLLLLKARPTEPALRTAFRIISHTAAEKLPLQKLKFRIIQSCVEFEKNRLETLDRIAEIGSEIIPRKGVVFTHCHSHTVEEILVRAWKKKRLQEVIATETRPLFQGRITAEKLTKKGIPVTFIVDSAAASFMKQADIFLTGCDAVLNDGSVVNKIGTSLISLAAFNERVPHYVATSSHKFDVETFFGRKEKIEERSEKEVWKKKLKKLNIRNPAFDITEAMFVKKIISEYGVLSPNEFVKLMQKQLVFKNKLFCFNK